MKLTITFGTIYFSFIVSYFCKRWLIYDNCRYYHIQLGYVNKPANLLDKLRGKK